MTWIRTMEKKFNFIRWKRPIYKSQKIKTYEFFYFSLRKYEQIIIQKKYLSGN